MGINAGSAQPRHADGKFGRKPAADFVDSAPMRPPAPGEQRSGASAGWSDRARDWHVQHITAAAGAAAGESAAGCIRRLAGQGEAPVRLSGVAVKQVAEAAQSGWDEYLDDPMHSDYIVGLIRGGDEDDMRERIVQRADLALSTAVDTGRATPVVDEAAGVAAFRKSRPLRDVFGHYLEGQLVPGGDAAVKDSGQPPGGVVLVLFPDGSGYGEMVLSEATGRRFPDGRRVVTRKRPVMLNPRVVGNAVIADFQPGNIPRQVADVW